MHNNNIGTVLLYGRESLAVKFAVCCLIGQSLIKHSNRIVCNMYVNKLL